MQTSNIRYALLSIVLLAGAGLYALLGEPLGYGTPRLPDADATYSVNAWSVGPSQYQRTGPMESVSRVYRTQGGTTATLMLQTYQAPKLYAPGPEVPFLGGGYTVSTPSTSLVPESHDGVGSLIAQRGAEQWTVMFAYGERRGLLGNGPVAWAFALLDGIVGRPNDYYKLYLAARTDHLDPSEVSSVAELAHTLFPRLAAWYAAA